MNRNPELRSAYRHCLRRAAAHYENFPVASRLLPRRLRGPIAAIYCYARDADDLADEDHRPVPERLQALRQMQEHVLALGNPSREPDPEWQALADTVHRFGLPTDPFIDLADAFVQDLEKTRYADFGDVMTYCRRSANPVGRLLLHLSGQGTPENAARSDAICSALQLINFYQDLHQDYAEHGRIYLPADEMARHGVTEQHLSAKISDFRIRGLMHYQYRRADRLLRSGAPLGGVLRGRLGLEIRAIVNGGARVLWLLQRQQDVFSRPRLGVLDGMVILRQSLFPRRA